MVLTQSVRVKIIELGARHLSITEYCPGFTKMVREAVHKPEALTLVAVFSNAFNCAAKGETAGISVEDGNCVVTEQSITPSRCSRWPRRA